jgi:lipopolysaccharide transport system ATP-binding protein
LSTVIKIENLGKQYRLGQIGTGTVAHDLNRWWAKIRGKEDPFLKIGETNDRTVKGDSEYVWALKDINFTVEQGDVLGIIGRNGAGKSTLLKILSRTTLPTVGSLKVKGRIASLLEVGTGFHPELSGRDNIFQNGALLGMTKKEIIRKFDEIVDFSGVERYIDTPVKRYSSGMYVRLAFAVAAHLESEILIVDEVLAVGDAEFQKKCLGKMGDVSKKEGRTVLFVSHNMSAIKTLCTKALFLKNGMTQKKGDISDVVNYYLSSYKDDSLSSKFEKLKIEGKEIELISAEVSDDLESNRSVFEIVEIIHVKFVVRCKKVIPNTYLYIMVQNDQEETFIESDSFDYPPNIIEQIKVGDNNFEFKINSNILPVGFYTIYISFASSYSNNFLIDTPGNILKFEIVDSITQRGIRRKANTSFLTKIILK